MELKIREIIFDDLYEFLKILEDVKFSFNADPKKSTTEVGFEAIKHLLAKFHTAKDKTNNFLGSLVGLSGTDFGKLPLRDSSKVLTSFIKEIKDSDFFSLSSLLARKK